MYPLPRDCISCCCRSPNRRILSSSKVHSCQYNTSWKIEILTVNWKCVFQRSDLLGGGTFKTQSIVFFDVIPEKDWCSIKNNKLSCIAHLLLLGDCGNTFELTFCWFAFLFVHFDEVPLKKWFVTICFDVRRSLGCM